MQITQHVYNMHIDDGAASHPGGSNNFFVGDPKEEMILIDTGDYERKWTRSILDYYEQLGSPPITAILITHGHGDHTGGLDRIQERLGAPVRCHPKLVQPLGKMLDDRELVIPLRSRERIVTGGGVGLRAIFTPGHEVDHVSYYLREDRIMFTGDTVLGASSTSVGDLSSYLNSLRQLTKFGHDIVCPAHGPVVPPPRGKTLVSLQLEHRLNREKQVIDAMRRGLSGLKEITADIYPSNLKKDLRPTAERNVKTHLEKLVGDGLVVESSSTYHLHSEG